MCVSCVFLGCVVVVVCYLDVMADGSEDDIGEEAANDVLRREREGLLIKKSSLIP